jgi:hypothetical protein
VRPRTLVMLFVASSIVTIGLNAAGAFDRTPHDGAHRMLEKLEKSNHRSVTVVRSGSSQDLPMVLLRTTAEGDEFAWTGRPAAAREIEIRSLLGSITAQPAIDDSIRVTALRYGDGKDNVMVKVLDRGERLTICAAHPKSRSSDGTVGCGTAVPSANGRKEIHGDARVNFVVQVPAGYRLVARAVDGRVEARGLRDDVEVSTVNGDVSIETAGAAEAKTMNGNIEARIGRLASHDNRFETLHGNVTLALPRGTAAALRAESITGSIHSDLAIQPKEMRRSKLIGTLGGGGPELLVKTVAGNVSLTSAP